MEANKSILKLFPNENEEKTDKKSLYGVLTEIKQEYGIQTFENPKKVIGLLSDLAPHLRKEKRLVVTIEKNGIFKSLYDGRNALPKEQKILFDSLVNRLANEELLNRDIVMEFLSVFTTLYGYVDCVEKNKNSNIDNKPRLKKEDLVKENVNKQNPIPPTPQKPSAPPPPSPPQQSPTPQPSPPQQSPTPQPQPQSKKKSKHTILKVIAVLIVLFIIWPKGDSEETYINTVKQSENTNYPGITCEDAFDSFFSNPKWSYEGESDGKHIVQFSGGCLYDKKEATVEIQYKIKDEAVSFSSLKINNISKTAEDYIGLLEVVYKNEETEEESVTDAESTNEPTKETIEESTKSTGETILAEEMNYVGADTLDYSQLNNTSDFTSTSSKDGVYTFMYPKNFFETGYYYTDEKKYEFIGADGETSLTITQEPSEISDSSTQANVLLQRIRGQFEVYTDSVNNDNSTPYIFQSKGASSDGFSKSIIGGPLTSDDSIGKYIVIAANSTTTYTMTYTYKISDPSGGWSGIVFSPVGYMMDCVYRGWSISGSTNSPRSYTRYLSEMSEG